MKLLYKLRKAMALLSILIFGSVAPAFSSTATHGPDWQSVALGALSIVLALVSAWATYMQYLLMKVREDLAQTRELVMSEYQTTEDVHDAVKAGVQEAINPINVRTARIEAGLEASGLLRRSGD